MPALLCTEGKEVNVPQPCPWGPWNLGDLDTHINKVKQRHVLSKPRAVTKAAYGIGTSWLRAPEQAAKKVTRS